MTNPLHTPHHASRDARRLDCWPTWKHLASDLLQMNGNELKKRNMYTPKIKTYNKERDALVRHCLRELAAENGWKVINVIRDGGYEKTIYRIK